MKGRAQAPLRALLNVIDLIVEWELHSKDERGSLAPHMGPDETIVLFKGQFVARCSRCGASNFRLALPGEFRLTSRLSCLACGEEVLHGTLIARLAKEISVAHGRRMRAPDAC